MFHWIQSIPVAVIAFIVMSYVISKASDWLGDALHVLGKKLNIPTSIRGATFDAVSSSFPEFTTAMVAVLVYKNFNDVGIPTVAGSAIFNILIIPMASIFAFKGAKIALNVDKKVALRDMGFYIVSIVALTWFTYSGSYGMVSGIVLISIYAAYLAVLYFQAKKHMLENTEPEVSEEEESCEDMSYSKILMVSAASMFAIWLSIDAMVQSAVVVSAGLGIPAYIVSVIILSGCTSIPDMLLSMKSASKGDADAAISNAIGSNIFDICICLGVPMMLAGQSIPANFSQNIGVLGFVFGSMALTGLLITGQKDVGKRHALAMFSLYVVFVGYIAMNAFTMF